MVVFPRLNRFYQHLHYLPGYLSSRWKPERVLREARGCRILVYHGICRNDPYRYNHLFITAHKFEAQLKLIRQYFNVVTLDQYFAKELSGRKFNICLTFDDGFANNYSFALPLLEKYQIPAQFFITGIRKAGYAILWNDFLSILQRKGPQKLCFQNRLYVRNRHLQYVIAETGYPLIQELRNAGSALKDRFIKECCSLISWEKEQDYWLQLSEHEIRKMAQSAYVTIGCHGLYHNDLARIPRADALQEMNESRQYLQELTQTSVHSIAFPYGSYCDGVLKDATEAGFTQLLATDLKHDCDSCNPAIKARLTINPYLMPDQQLLATIKGSYAH